MAMSPLFAEGPAKDPDFLLCRDDERYRNCRSYIERLWIQYAPYCPDTEFAKRIRHEFHQRTWEMRLACSLLESGHKLLKTEQKGPDLRIEGDVPIWVEAVAVEAGDSVDRVLSAEERRDKTMRHERPDLCWSGDPPSEESIILRCTHALKRKVLKIRRYKKDGVISGTDPVVIAICIGRIDENCYYSMAPGPSIFIKSFFGIGEECVFYSPGSGKGLTPGYTDRPVVARTSARHESTRWFLGDEARDVSGVLGSCMSIFHASSNDQGLLPDFIHVNNPSAIAPYKRGAIRLGTEYRAEGGIIRRCDER